MLVYDFDHYFYFTNILEINLIGYELFPLFFFFFPSSIAYNLGSCTKCSLLLILFCYSIWKSRDSTCQRVPVTSKLLFLRYCQIESKEDMYVHGIDPDQFLWCYGKLVRKCFHRSNTLKCCACLSIYCSNSVQKLHNYHARITFNNYLL